MNLSAIGNSVSFKALAAKVQGFGDRADGFQRLLQQESSNDDDKKLREVAGQLVAQTFFVPLLKQARDSVFKIDMFHGGFGEDAFGSQLDQELADRMAMRNGVGLIDAIVDRYSAGKPNSESSDKGVDVNG